MKQNAIENDWFVAIFPTRWLERVFAQVVKFTWVQAYGTVLNFWFGDSFPNAAARCSFGTRENWDGQNGKPNWLQLEGYSLALGATLFFFFSSNFSFCFSHKSNSCIPSLVSPQVCASPLVVSSCGCRSDHLIWLNQRFAPLLSSLALVVVGLTTSFG